MLSLHVLPKVGTHEKHPRLGVVDEGLDVFAGELVQHRHDDGTVGGDGKIGDGPVGAVAAAERDLVALPDAHGLEILPKTSNLFGNLCKRVIHVAVVVRQRGLVPVFWENLVIVREKMFGHFVDCQVEMLSGDDPGAAVRILQPACLGNDAGLAALLHILDGRTIENGELWTIDVNQTVVDTHSVEGGESVLYG